MSNEPIAVPDESGENIIYIRAGKMPWGIKNKVQGAAVQISAGLAGNDPQTRITVAAYQAALMLHNIVRWEGPALQGFKLTQAGLDMLDPDHGDAVLTEIQRQNPARTSPNRTSPTTATSTSAGATNTPTS
jgi:hypothetical protein